MLSQLEKKFENEGQVSPLGAPQHGPELRYNGAPFGDNVLNGLKITYRNFNQLEAAFRHPPEFGPGGLQVPSQLA